MAKRTSARTVAAEPRSRRPEWLWPTAALALLAIAVYANSISNGFVGDDKIQLLKNPVVTDASKFWTIFGSSVWSFIGVKGNYYRPLQFLAYMLLYQCAGFHAAAFHLFMVLLHVANTVLLYLVVRRLAASRIALAAGALFTVHPIHTEVIDWIAALPDLMVTTLVLLGILLLIREGGVPRGRQIAIHSGLYLLALWTKETGLVMLPLYAGYAFFYLGDGWIQARRNVSLYSAMTATFCVYLAMRRYALGGFAPGQQTFFHLGPVDFAMNVVITAAQYVGKLLLPANLNYFHIFHPARSFTPEFLISLSALLALAVVPLRLRKPLISYGIFWFAVTVAPALNLTGVGQNVFAERYLYLPSAGFCWIAGCAWDWLAAREMKWATVAAAAVLLVSMVEVVLRNRDWQDDFTLLQVTVLQSPGSGWVHDTLAGVYVERDAFQKALEQEQLAVKYEPDNALFHKKLGYILLGYDVHGAIAEFRKSIQLEPGVAASHYDLGFALEASGDAGQAAGEYEKAMRLDPQLREAREGLGRVRAKL